MAAAWIQHASCTHPIAGCRDRSRIVGRQRYPNQVSARAHWCSNTKAMPDRQRQGFFSRFPKKLSKQGLPRLRNYNTLGKSGHRAPAWIIHKWASFFGQSAVISSSQSISLALCLDSLSQIDAVRSLQCRHKVAQLQRVRRRTL